MHGPHPDRRQVLGGSLAAAVMLAAPPADAEPRELPRRLARGLNLSHWFAQSFEGYGESHLASFVTAANLDAVAKAGFGHVRLGLEPAAMFGEAAEPRLDARVLDSLLAALDRIKARDLAVVLDLHPVGAAKDALLSPAGADRLVASWALLAKALRGRSGDDLVLEVLNEPEPAKGRAWWTLQQRTIRAIRDAGATGPVVVNGGGWSGVDDLVAQAAYPDPGLVYTVHHYAPLLFTHQSADWTWDVARQIRNLAWPIAARDADERSAAAQDERSRGFLKADIAAGRFTREALEADLDRLAAWARRAERAPIYVGEFGVYAKAAPPEARLSWVSACRQAFEARGFGWALWDSSPSFGLRAREGSDWTFDPAMLGALGMRS